MLKSEDAASEQTPSLNAGQARVTPEELTQALAAIETRKQAEASRLARTIPLHEAVSDLHLDSTPEEIWAEVQSQRVKAAPMPQTFAEAEAARREQVRPAPPVVGSFRNQQVLSGMSGQYVQPPRRGRHFIRPFIPFLALWALFGSGILPHAWHHLLHNNSVATMSLAQISDGQDVYADRAALIQVSEGKPLADVQVRKTHMDNDWKLVKIGSHVYLSGSILNTKRLGDISGKALNIYNDDNSGELHGNATSNITLPVDNIPLQTSGGDDDYSEITVLKFQPDSRTTLNDGH